MMLDLNRGANAYCARGALSGGLLTQGLGALAPGISEIVHAY